MAVPSVAVPPRPPGEPVVTARHAFHRNFERIFIELFKANQTLALIEQHGQQTGLDLETEVLLFLIDGVGPATGRFQIKGGHKWVPLFTRKGFNSLADFANFPGSAEEIQKKFLNSDGTLPADAPRVDELELLVEIARLLTASPRIAAAPAAAGQQGTTAPQTTAAPPTTAVPGITKRGRRRRAGAPSRKGRRR